MFPSPFGVRVLKFRRSIRIHQRLNKVSVPFRGSCSEISSMRARLILFVSVSVPFRGSCSEMLPPIKLLRYSQGLVSVPFRGSCSEIQRCTLYGALVGSFRPLSGFVF